MIISHLITTNHLSLAFFLCRLRLCPPPLSSYTLPRLPLNKVRLKWLDAPPEGANNGSQLLETVRAGHRVLFECAAAAQPRPRVRWFRLIRAPPQASLSRLDESQIRSLMNQVENSQATSYGGDIGLQRLEIGNNRAHHHSMANSGDWMQQQAAFLVEQVASWRVETSAGSGEHEIRSRLLLDKASPSQAGLYECQVSVSDSDAASQQDLQPISLRQRTHHSSDDKLHRIFGLAVNGK